jgi:hypothetical protein
MQVVQPAYMPTVQYQRQTATAAPVMPVVAPIQNMTQQAGVYTPPGCTLSSFTQVQQMQPGAQSNRISAIPSTVAVQQQQTGCCKVQGPNGEDNIATLVPTQFKVNQNVKFASFAGDTASSADQVMQSTCVVSGFYIPDTTRYKGYPPEFTIQAWQHHFMKVSLMTILSGNITVSQATAIPATGGTGYQSFPLAIPVPGMNPVSLSGSVSGTIALKPQGSQQIPIGTASVIADIDSTKPGYIVFAISFPGGVFAPGQILDLGFVLTYISGPQ